MRPRPSGIRTLALVLLGVPFAGSIDALLALQEGTRVGFRRVGPEVLATMPSLYELLPQPELNPIVEPNGGHAAIDLFEPEDWERYGLGLFSPRSSKAFLKDCRRVYPTGWKAKADGFFHSYRAFLKTVLGRSKNLHRALRQGLRRLPEGFVVVVGGDSVPTLAHAVLSRHGRARRLHFAASVVPGLYEAGDGVVTRTSWELPARFARGARTVHVKARHRRLPRERKVLELVVKELRRADGGSNRR